MLCVQSEDVHNYSQIDCLEGKGEWISIVVPIESPNPWVLGNIIGDYIGTTIEIHSPHSLLRADRLVIGTSQLLWQFGGLRFRG